MARASCLKPLVIFIVQGRLSHSKFHAAITACEYVVFKRNDVSAILAAQRSYCNLSYEYPVGEFPLGLQSSAKEFHSIHKAHNQYHRQPFCIKAHCRYTEIIPSNGVSKKGAHRKLVGELQVKDLKRHLRRPKLLTGGKKNELTARHTEDFNVDLLHDDIQTVPMVIEFIQNVLRALRVDVLESCKDVLTASNNLRFFRERRPYNLPSYTNDSELIDGPTAQS
ncbi:hypothetical protein KIN20_014354 [Parelaphostrongylus tenuis]|uniref:Uncharacterized protein n=1 Tax=Parelaphostrongylus tenuis TaxID=148309 RepID=A0AAD5QPC6_PARTN|nr:hypothetical protein KIN20_014354 [Parelaphostrongylus tenuis]